MGSENYPICTACGSQFDPVDGGNPSNCKICDDPRQYVPAAGQTWTTLSHLRDTHSNKWKQDPNDSRIWTFWTEPKFAIGQRAFLLQTPHGNIMWDMISLIDEATIDFINPKGGLTAIVVSHPHYYTTYIEWARAFNCPIHIAQDDEEWLCRSLPDASIVDFLDGPAGTTMEVVPGVTVIKAGGHFPGSLLLHWERRLFIADTIVTVPSAFSPHPRPPGQTTFVFQWSIPNSIPLPPDQILQVWRAVRPFEFDFTHGAFNGMDIYDKEIKGRMLESMKIQVRAEGHEKHGLLEEVL